MHCERIRLLGRVQGVGMRPTVQRLAAAMGMRGLVRNDADGVELLIAAPADEIQQLLDRLAASLPPLARVDELRRERLAVAPELPAGFHIGATAAGAGQAAQSVALPDVASCSECVAEALQPGQHRYRYPFGSCTHCGPRLSVQRDLPWDRGQTSFSGFEPCPRCVAEFGDAANRRFHAQTIACPDCGPVCWLSDDHAEPLAHGASALEQAAVRLREGAIVAIKGLGGFHLACLADQSAPIARLRQRKNRPHKPLALMGADLAQLRDWVELDAPLVAALQGPSAPIVLAPARTGQPTLELLAPGLQQLGVMLPATPLQHLLLAAVGRVLVMTSGNLSGRPPCTDNAEALEQLGPVADAFLLHDLDIANRLDDSVMQLAAGELRVLRLGRGLAPHRGRSPVAAPRAILGLGGQLKSSICLLRGTRWQLSQHIGDLHQAANLRDYKATIERYQRLFRFRPEVLVVDQHPDYQSRQHAERWAREAALPLLEVQHHHAHAVAVMAEYQLPPEQGPWLSLIFDGLGYGADGGLWGGEFLCAGYQDYARLGHLRDCPLPGGAQAQRQPWRNLHAQLRANWSWEEFAQLYPALYARLAAEQATETLEGQLANRRISPLSSSMGRLFDAVSSALALAPGQQSYEGQAAMLLQAQVDQAALREREQAYVLSWTEDGGQRILDPASLWPRLCAEIEAGLTPGLLAARFHRGLAMACALLARELVETQALPRTVILGGGVFQNALLLGCLSEELAALGLRALAPVAVPANDGGLALGQALVAACRLQEARP